MFQTTNQITINNPWSHRWDYALPRGKMISDQFDFGFLATTPGMGTAKLAKLVARLIMLGSCWTHDQVFKPLGNHLAHIWPTYSKCLKHMIYIVLHCMLRNCCAPSMFFVLRNHQHHRWKSCSLQSIRIITFSHSNPLSPRLGLGQNWLYLKNPDIWKIWSTQQ